jgi:outer membrane protein
MRKGQFLLLSVIVFIFGSLPSSAQTSSDSLLQVADLQNVVQYALKRQPQVQQALTDEQITEAQIKSRLSEWYPQVNFNYLYQHNFQVQSAVIGGNVVRLGVNNTSALQFSGSQSIFNRDVLLASRTKTDVRQLAKQTTENTKIEIVSGVMKAFYDVLTSEQQNKVIRGNIARLERALKDTRARYDAGIADKTDYKRATIALNNSRANRKSNDEALKAKIDYLKALMNYPPSEPLQIVYDSTSLATEIIVDTLQPAQYASRIEYQILQSQRRLQAANVSYNKWSYIPSLSANGAYNLNYQNNNYGKLYSQSFPNSYVGLTLSFPIFQGGKRKFNTLEAELELKRTDLDIVNLKNTITAEYSAALAGYKGSLANYIAIRDNVELAQEVYDVILLQYNSGIKSYLEVSVAETDLRTAQINYYNALNDVLNSKVDVLRSLGQINP